MPRYGSQRKKYSESILNRLPYSNSILSARNSIEVSLGKYKPQIEPLLSIFKTLFNRVTAILTSRSYCRR